MKLTNTLSNNLPILTFVVSANLIVSLRYCISKFAGTFLK